MRNGSLGSGVVSEKEVIFHEFDFKTSLAPLFGQYNRSNKFSLPCQFTEWFIGGPIPKGFFLFAKYDGGNINFTHFSINKKAF